MNNLPDHTVENKREKTKVGMLLGAIAGLVFAISLWGINTVRLAQANAVQPWAKLMLGIFPVILLCVLAAWITNKFPNGLINVIVWAVTGLLITFFAAHLSFEGITLYYKITDPLIAARVNYPFDSGAQSIVGFVLIINALLFALAGLLFGVYLENTYSAAYSGAAVITSLVWLLIFVAAGSMQNYIIERPLTDPVVATNRAIEYKLQDEITPYSADEARSLWINSMNSITDLLHSPRKLVLLSYNSDQTTNYVGIDFSGVWASCYVVPDRSAEPPVQQPIYCKKVE